MRARRSFVFQNLKTLLDGDPIKWSDPLAITYFMDKKETKNSKNFIFPNPAN